MVDTLVPPDQDIDPSLAALSKRARLWLLVVACLGVSNIRHRCGIPRSGGMDSSLLTLAIVTAVAAPSVATWAPGRGGRQLRIVRRLGSVRRARAMGRHRA